MGMNLNRILKQPGKPAEIAGENHRRNNDFHGLLPRRAALAPIESAAESLLTVGRGIEITGEIGACDSLVVEGHVNAAVTAQHLEVRDGGLFQGAAEVATARVAGRVDGDLSVRGLLTIPAGGRAAGKIRYGELAIEPGGQIAGDIDAVAEAVPMAAEEEAVA